jgi:hypothetical protein
LPGWPLKAGFYAGGGVGMTIILPKGFTISPSGLVFWGFQGEGLLLVPTLNLGIPLP